MCLSVEKCFTSFTYISHSSFWWFWVLEWKSQRILVCDDIIFLSAERQYVVDILCDFESVKIWGHRVTSICEHDCWNMFFDWSLRVDYKNGVTFVVCLFMWMNYERIERSGSRFFLMIFFMKGDQVQLLLFIINYF